MTNARGCGCGSTGPPNGMATRWRRWTRSGKRTRKSMSDTPLLDTHIWIWWMGRDVRLGNGIIDQLDAFPVEHRPYLSDISLMEVALLTSGGRLSLPVPLEE